MSYLSNGEDESTSMASGVRAALPRSGVEAAASGETSRRGSYWVAEEALKPILGSTPHDDENGADPIVLPGFNSGVVVERAAAGRLEGEDSGAAE